MKPLLRALYISLVVAVVILGIVCLLCAALTHAATYDVVGSPSKMPQIEAVAFRSDISAPPTPKAPIKPNIAQVQAYVRAQAIENGINPVIALFIVAHESQNGTNLVGKEPNGTVSYGYWQFNDANPDFNYSCAMDLTCSTMLAMDWLKAGKWNAWTTWANRCSWFPYDHPPNCPVDN